MVDYSKFDDQELLIRLKKGEEGAFNEIYHRYKGVLHLHAYKKLGDFEEAKDAVQDVFATLWDKRESLPVSDNFSGYLYQMLRHRILNTLAHQQVESRYLTSLGTFLEAGDAISDHQVRERQLAAQIEAEIQKLPPKMREAFVMSRKAYLSHKEIADKLEVSEFTVKNHIKAALKILRTRLGSMFLVL